MDSSSWERGNGGCGYPIFGGILMHLDLMHLSLYTRTKEPAARPDNRMRILLYKLCTL